MNKELLDSMNKQMSPSPEARAALNEKLAQPARKRPVPWIKYGAIAACAALVIGVFPFYQAMKGLDNINGQEILWTHRAGMPLHSYVTVEGLTGTVTENAAVSDKGGGGRENYSTGVIDRDTYAGDILDRPQVPNTGDLPGGAYVGDVPVQEGAEDYQKLMDHFNGALPDWYGGAYIDPSGALIVNLVEAHDSADKTLALQIQDWAGGPVGFGSVKYSLSYLRRLQEQAFDAMYGLGLSVGCSVDEEAGRVVLTLSSVTDEALALLAELDPEDDAILVLAGPFAQDGSGVIQPGGEEDLTVDKVISADQPGVIQSPEPARVENAIQYDLPEP